MKIGAPDADPFWTQFLRSLKRRGLNGVKLVIRNIHDGIKAAAAKVLKIADMKLSARGDSLARPA